MRLACSDTKDIDFLHSIGEHSVGYYLNTQGMPFEASNYSCAPKRT